MKVELIDYQRNALDLLIYSKSTRLKHGNTLEEVGALSYDDKIQELEYIKNTIKSSWEFVRYIFKISEVSRSFTHQLVRTRNASYAQESMRAVKKNNNEYITPNYKIAGNPEIHHAIMEDVFGLYNEMILMGEEIQNAREILPAATSTSIIMGVSLRELSHMAETRLCTRTSGEYQEVFKLIKQRVAEVHPYFDDMIEVYCVRNGTCCFPNYTECPVQNYVLHFDDVHWQMIKEAHSQTTHVSNPIANKGKTQ